MIATMRVIPQSTNAALATTLVLWSLCGCTAGLPPSAFSSGTPEMRPEIFFAGSVRSSGVQENRSGVPIARFHVESIGLPLADGTFRLEQNIAFEEKAAQTRTWILRRVDAHRYTATLTDAAGPVEAEAYGDLFHLRYPMKTPWGAQMEQWLYRSHGDQRSDCARLRSRRRPPFRTDHTRRQLTCAARRRDPAAGPRTRIATVHGLS